MCGVCKVFSVVYSPTLARARLQFWFPYDQASYVYTVFPVLLSGKVVDGKACLAATDQMSVTCRAQGQGCHRWPSGQSQGRSCSETARLGRPISSWSNCATAHQSAKGSGESALLAPCCSNSLYHITEAPSRQQRNAKERISTWFEQNYEDVLAWAALRASSWEVWARHDAQHGQI